MRRLSLALSAALALTPVCANAQWPVKTLKNVKALPANITPAALVDTMKGFTRALGVRCTYCHVGQEGASLETYDFASDEKPAKLKARAMIAMATAINSDYLAKISDRRQPQIAVTCITCHRGVTEPRPLQQVVLSAYDAAGADSAIAAYRALRTRYYGRSAFDFGEVPLVDVADNIRARGKLPDAIRIYLLNTELLPTSTFALRSIAGAYIEKGDTAAAIAAFEKAVSINPRDQQSIDALKGLKKGG